MGYSGHPGTGEAAGKHREGTGDDGEKEQMAARMVFVSGIAMKRTRVCES